MDKHDNYHLLDYSKTLYESNRHGKPYCRVGVSLDGGELTVWRLDLLNTHQFCSSLKKYYSVAVVKEMKKRFGNRVSYHEFIDNFRQFCDDNGIEYNYNVWY